MYDHRLCTLFVPGNFEGLARIVACGICGSLGAPCRDRPGGMATAEVHLGQVIPGAVHIDITLVGQLKLKWG